MRQGRAEERRSAVLLGLVLSFAIVAVSALVLAFQSNDAKKLAECRARLETAGAVFEKYMDGSPDHLGPKLSSVKGKLTIDDILPSGISSETSNGLIKSIYTQEIVDDSTVLYLGYMLENAQDLEALSAYYIEKMGKGESLDDTVPLPKPQPDGRNVVLRIRRLTDRPSGSAWSGWYRDPSIIPVFVEREEAHGGQGAHVVFLDGHVAFYPSARSNVWPFDRREIGPLRDMDALQP